MEPVSDAFTDSHPQRGRRKRLAVIETQPSRFVRHTRRCEAEFPVPISDAGGCETKKNDSPPREKKEAQNSLGQQNVTFFVSRPQN